jgi:hypothetical protein
MIYKILLIIFIGAGFGAGKAIQVQYIRDSDAIACAVSLSIVLIGTSISYRFLFREVKKSHEKNIFVIHGVKTIVWLLLPPVAVIVGLVMALTSNDTPDA